MKSLVILGLLCFFTLKLISCQDEPEVDKEIKEAADDDFDAYNVTIDEKIAFVNRWCTGDKMSIHFMKALITCRDKTLTPDEIKKEEECFAKIYNGKDLKVVHDEEEERKFACHAENKTELILKYEDVKTCVGKDDEWRKKHRKEMKKCMRDNTEEMRAMQDMAVDFIERWCQKEEGPMNFMKGYVACRDTVVAKDLMAREEVCFQNQFGKDISLKALHEEEAEREMVCGFKNKKDVLKKHHLVWACVKPTPEEMKTYKHDFKECMDKRGLKFQ